MNDGDQRTASFIERKSCLSCGYHVLIELAAGRFDEGALKRFIEEDPWGEHPAPYLRGKPWSYVACESCGLAFHRYILDEQWNERRFSKWMSQDAIAAFEKPLRTFTNDFLSASRYTAHVLQLEQLTRAIRGSKAPRILDFGCGYGGFLTICSTYGFEAFGVDRSAAKRDNSSFRNVFSKIDEIADRAPFHALTLFEVLEHLDDPQGLMRQLQGLLAHGGVLVLETPDCSGVRNIETKEDYRKIHPLEHINGFTPETLLRFGMRLGFEPIRKPIGCVTCDSIKLAKTIAKRVLNPVMAATTQLYFRKP